MTRRGLLNITSRKKRDTLMPTTGTGFIPGNGLPAGVTGGIGLDRGYAMFAFMPFARTAHVDNVAFDNVSNQAQRTATNCFAKGYRDDIKISTNSSHSWEWRRIVFFFKGPGLISPEGEVDALGVAQLLEYDGTPAGDGGAIGYRRKLANLSPESGSGSAGNVIVHDNFVRAMFRGQPGADWNNPFNAPINKDLISVIHDRKRVFRTGNDRGSVWEIKKYHSINKSLWYNDREVGDHMEFSPYSAEIKKSCGDVYIVDLIAPAFGATEDDSLIFNPTGSVYWHER